jgi:VWFA-related protein
VFTNRVEYASSMARNVTAIVLDAMNTLPSQQPQVRQQLLRSLHTIAPGTRIAVYQLGARLTIVHGFTDNLASVRSRIAKFASEPATQASIDLDDATSGDAAAVEQASRVSSTFGASLQEALAAMRRAEEGYVEQVDDRKRNLTLAWLEALGTQLAGIPGRKSLVWIGNGIPIHSNAAGFLQINDTLFRGTARRLASQGVTVYPVAAQGLLAPAMLTGSTARGASRGGPPPRTQVGLPDQRAWATMDLFANLTGGRVSRNTNDLADGVKAAASDLLGAYSVGFYAAGNPDGSWHDVDVTVKRRDVTLLHRQGYLAQAPAPQPVHWSEAHWRWAIENPLGSTVLHLDARFESVPKTPAGTYDLLLLLSPDELHFRTAGEQKTADIEVVVAEKLQDGSYSFNVGARQLSVPAGTATAGTVVRYMDRWTVRLGAITIRLIVRDRFTGRYGTLDVPVAQLPGR